jgi:hypothetical protein
MTRSLLNNGPELEVRMNWKLEAELSQNLGATEWISATLKIKKKSFTFSNSDSDFDKPKKTPFGVDLQATAHGIHMIWKGREGRELTVTMSPLLLCQLIIAYGAEAAKAGEQHPLAEAARALTRAQTSIVNRERPGGPKDKARVR